MQPRSNFSQYKFHRNFFGGASLGLSGRLFRHAKFSEIRASMTWRSICGGREKKFGSTGNSSVGRLPGEFAPFSFFPFAF
jgi:hypothetical protein